MNDALCTGKHSGGYCDGVPPLPIPNREVKPAHADGTAMQCGRVGSRRLYGGAAVSMTLRLSLFVVTLTRCPTHRLCGLAGIVALQMHVSRLSGSGTQVSWLRPSYSVSAKKETSFFVLLSTFRNFGRICNLSLYKGSSED